MTDRKSGVFTAFSSLLVPDFRALHVLAGGRMAETSITGVDR